MTIELTKAEATLVKMLLEEHAYEVEELNKSNTKEDAAELEMELNTVKSVIEKLNI